MPKTLTPQAAFDAAIAHKQACMDAEREAYFAWLDNSVTLRENRRRQRAYEAAAQATKDAQVAAEAARKALVGAG